MDYNATLKLVFFSDSFIASSARGVLGYLAIRVCAAGKGMVCKPFGLVKGLVIIENWSNKGSRLMGLLTKD